MMSSGNCFQPVHSLVLTLVREFLTLDRKKMWASMGSYLQKEYYGNYANNELDSLGW